jgi:hypothetical protein
VVAEFSAEAIDSEGGAASDDEIFEDDASEWEESTWSLSSPVSLKRPTIVKL